MQRPVGTRRGAFLHDASEPAHTILPKQTCLLSFREIEAFNERPRPVLAKRERIIGAAAHLVCAERIHGPDQILPFDLSWGAGVLRNTGIGIYGPGEETFGHSGWGGSCGLADPRRRLSAAYVMNRQSPYLIGDPRSRRLIDALYAGL